MILYRGNAEKFYQDIVETDKESGKRVIVSKLINEFQDKFRREPEDGEIISWDNSLKEISEVFNSAGLKEQEVLIEFQLPLSSKRIDCIVIGQDEYGKNQVVVIELKQWQKCSKSKLKESVVTTIGGRKKMLLHPSVQVGNYLDYLKNATNLFNEIKDIDLAACVYLHNYTISDNDPLIDDKFNDVINNYPVFLKEDKEKIIQFIKEKVSYSVNGDIVEQICGLKFETNRRLNDSLVNVISGETEYILLDEQKLAFDTIIAAVESKKIGKKVIIVNGGPGTGKSVIAINLLAYFLRQGKKVNYVTGSKWFTKNLRSILEKETTGNYFFKYFMQYNRSSTDEFDLLICDESHRIRDEQGGSSLYQVQQIINAAKVSVFFIDNNQHIRPNEVGTSQYIEQKALDYKEKKKCELTIWKTKLEAEFRCGGMNGFISWIDNTLDIEKTSNILWKCDNDSFEFKICSTPEEVDTIIRQKQSDGYKSRMMAGFCWPWHEEGNSDGTLVNDVTIGEYKRPWNPSDNANPKVKENSEIPKPELWATDKNGINQIGCIYTAQGFEFDYIGVILGRDLVYDRGWKVIKENSYDSSLKRCSEVEALRLLKNTYRVLLSRGIKGCYVYFQDKNTERFFKSRME